MRSIFVISLAMVCLMLGAAHAQVATNPIPNPKAEAQWNRFLAKHPGVQARLVNDPNYLAKHPGMGNWLRDHPQVKEMHGNRDRSVAGTDRTNGTTPTGGITTTQTEFTKIIRNG